jgi:hypothetical protein
MARRGLLVALLPVAFLVGGCQYLFGFGAQPAPGDPGGFAEPSPQAAFSQGSATVKIDGVETRLDQMPHPGTLYESLGFEATWTDGNGLYLRLYGPIGIGVVRPEAFITLERIRDGQHWTTASMSDCRVTLDQGDASGIKGSGTCTGMRWSDSMASFTGLVPPYIEGEAAFDVVVTFEATP